MQKIASGFKARAGLLKALFHQRQHSVLLNNLKFLRSRFFWIGVSCALILYWSIDSAQAQFAWPRLFDGVRDQAQEKALGTWLPRIRNLAETTFKILAVIEICWAAVIWAFEKDNLNSLAVEMIQKIMFIGFFYVLLSNAPDWIPRIVNTFQAVGEDANDHVRLTPDSIMELGFESAQKIWDLVPTNFFNVIAQLFAILLAIVVILCVIISHVIIALQLLALNIESYVLLAAGALLLAFGSSRWTSEYVSKYLQYALTVGMRLLVLLLILGITQTALKAHPVNELDYGPLFNAFVIVLMQAMLAIKAPEMGGALMSGGIGFSAGSASSAAGSMVGTAFTAFKAAKTGSNKAKGQNATGGGGGSAFGGSSGNARGGSSSQLNQARHVGNPSAVPNPGASLNKGSAMSGQSSSSSMSSQSRASPGSTGSAGSSSGGGSDSVKEDSASSLAATTSAAGNAPSSPTVNSSSSSSSNSTTESNTGSASGEQSSASSPSATTSAAGSAPLSSAVSTSSNSPSSSQARAATYKGPGQPNKPSPARMPSALGKGSNSNQK